MNKNQKQEKRPVGRPKGDEPTVVIPARIPESLANRLSKYASEHKLTRNKATGVLLRRALDSL